MAQDWDLDFGGKKAGDVEREISRLPEGYYYATFHSHEDNDKTLAKTLHFVISRGPGSGKKVDITLGHPKMAENEDKGKKAAQRMAAIATRMGAVAAESTGRATTNFAKCIGNEFIVKVVHREGKEGGTFVNIDYAGVYPKEGHDEIPNSAREVLGLALKEGKKKGGGDTSATVPAAAGAAGAGAGTQTPAAKLW